MRRIFFLLVMIGTVCGVSAQDGSDLARVNLSGYAYVPEFTLTFSPGSRINIDGRRVSMRSCRILPAQKSLVTEKSGRLIFELVTIRPANGDVTGFTTPVGTQQFRGRIEIRAADEGILIINTLPVRDYLASVLGGEMGENFRDEALKAQAVAIRSYYYAKRRLNRRQAFDVSNTDGVDMVYRGSGFATDKMYEIMKQTAGLFLVGPDERPALALFHSTSGGLILKDKVFTSDFYNPPQEPVLRKDTDEKGRPLASSSPYFTFDITLSGEQLIRALYPVVRLSRLTDIRLRYFPGTACVDFIGLIDQDGNTHWIKGFNFVSLVQQHITLGLGSIDFSVQKQGGRFRFTGRGFGHQCGMSQYSAEKLAQGGYGFKQILRRYYPQYKLVAIPAASALLRK